MTIEKTLHGQGRSLTDCPVYVYKNLHKNVWSIRSNETGEKRLVIGYTNYLTLKDCKFLVSEKGRQRVLKEKKKNVHAGISGIIETFDYYWKHRWEHSGSPRTITYDPYKNESFIDAGTNEPVVSAAIVLLLIFEDGTSSVIGYGTKVRS